MPGRAPHPGGGGQARGAGSPGRVPAGDTTTGPAHPAAVPELHQTPEALVDRVFSREAALRAGLSSRQLRTPRYQRLSAGIWTSPPDGAPDLAPRQQLARLLEALHDELPLQALSHVSAALYWGFRLPWRMQRLLPLHLTRIDDGPRVMRPGFIGHRATNDLLLRRGDDGIRVTGPSRTLVDIAGLLEHRELVAVIDGVICTHRTGRRQGLPRCGEASRSPGTCGCSGVLVGCGPPARLCCAPARRWTRFPRPGCGSCSRTTDSPGS